MRARPPVPSWFVCLVTLAAAVVCRWLAPAIADPVDGVAVDAAPQLAWFGWLVTLAGFIWDGAQVAYHAIVTALQWSVKALWSFAILIHNGLKATIRTFALVGKNVWKFFQATYDKVIRPAWQHFWRWFDRATAWLEKIARPVLRWLDRVHRWITRFYTDYIRPILDAFGIARRLLRVLQSFGLDWARKLDERLGDLESRIAGPFRTLLRYVNEIANVINRIVTLDGLIQRLALVRSIERDIKIVADSFKRWRMSPVTDRDRIRRRDLARDKQLPVVVANAGQAIQHGTGPYASTVTELAATWSKHFEGTR